MSASGKVTIFLKNVGDAPTLQNRFVAAPEDWEVSKIIKFIRNELKRDDRTSVFVYVKSSFTPSPDEKIGVLADAFGTVEAGTKKLTVHYALTPAWG